MAFVLAVLPHPVGQAITDPQRYAETNIAERNELRRAAFEMTRGEPGRSGWGRAAFALFHQDYRDADADLPDRDLDVAYSTPLEASAELGVLGAVALYAVCRGPRRPRPAGGGCATAVRLAAATLLALDGLLVASLIESAQFLLPLWFLAAMAVALGRPTRPRAARCSADNSSGQVEPDSEFRVVGADYRKNWPRRRCVPCATRGASPHWGRDAGRGILAPHDGRCTRGVWAPVV